MVVPDWLWFTDKKVQQTATQTVVAADRWKKEYMTEHTSQIYNGNESFQLEDRILFQQACEAETSIMSTVSFLWFYKSLYYKNNSKQYIKTKTVFPAFHCQY